MFKMNKWKCVGYSSVAMADYMTERFRKDSGGGTHCVRSQGAEGRRPGALLRDWLCLSYSVQDTSPRDGATNT